jgi:hypothetical protein
MADKVWDIAAWQADTWDWTAWADAAAAPVWKGETNLLLKLGGDVYYRLYQSTGVGTGDMLASVYDPAGGASQVAFETDLINIPRYQMFTYFT